MKKKEKKKKKKRKKRRKKMKKKKQKQQQGNVRDVCACVTFIHLAKNGNEENFEERITKMFLVCLLRSLSHIPNGDLA